MLKETRYSGTSISGLSKIWTQCNKPLYKGHDSQPHVIPTVQLEPPKEENLSTKNKGVEFMPSPKCHLSEASTKLKHTTHSTVMHNSASMRSLAKSLSFPQLIMFVYEEKDRQ